MAGRIFIWPFDRFYAEHRPAREDGGGIQQRYVAASVCAVSRAGLLTGRRPQEFGFTYNISDDGDDGMNAGLPLSERTIADRLKALGYRTAAFGKWHQGQAERYYPTRRGFDDFFGFLSGETVYIDPKTPGIVTTPTKADHYPIDHRPAVGEVVEGPAKSPVHDFDKYLTDEITDHTVSFVRDQVGKKQPFFAYVAYNAPHWPLQVPQVWYDKFPQIKDPVRRTYVAMIAAMDAGVGKILDELERTGARKNTLIFFLSDNGCPVQFGFCEPNHPLGAGKFTYIEGGIRVPFAMSWPAGLKPHGVVDTPVVSMDILPTALRAAAPHMKMPKELEGQDLVATVLHPAAKPRTLLWGQEPVYAVRRGNYKLWRSYDWNKTYLYDLGQDMAEAHDLLSSKKAEGESLVRSLETWRRTLPKPQWRLHGTRPIEDNGHKTEWVY